MTTTGLFCTECLREVLERDFDLTGGKCLGCAVPDRDKANAILTRQDAIRDAAGWYGDTCADPELFSDRDRAGALHYLRSLTRGLKVALLEETKEKTNES